MSATLEYTSARVLELDSLLGLVRGYAQSPLGQERVSRLVASTDRSWIELQQQLTSEVRAFLRSGGRFDFSGLHDPGTVLEKSRIDGAMLEPEEIRDVLVLVERADEWRALVQEPPTNFRRQAQERERRDGWESDDPWPAISAFSGGIADFTELLRSFRNKILPDGSLDDRASPALAHIRRDIEKQKRTIHESLRAYVRHLASEGAVQDELVTIRGERFVIPVKTEQRRRVQGV
ncbi:MAG: endonuclease MutS2, partial [Candidatus Korobacteraceae bacterium]